MPVVDDADASHDWIRSSCGKYSTFAQPLEKSKNDDRDYRLIRLANDLEVLLVQDEKADKASAALDVHVGHMSDPSNLPGLAHFCEHLLFMGTEKYPIENEYSKYLSDHSGYSNAYTSTVNTNYHFAVGYEHFEGALDRFAQFFINPLFTESCTERELEAVNSEHQKNKQNDSWRLFQLQKSLSNPKHPFCKFGTGNIETLRNNPMKEGTNLRSELLKFHDQYYSANIMKLCILGRESLDELTKWAVEKFSQVNNKGIDPPSLNFTEKPLTHNELKKQIFVKPVMGSNKLLQMEFPIPDQYPFYTVKPARYISHMVGHEAAGSILSLLKKKTWATDLSVGPSHLSKDVEFCVVIITLTEEGLENYKDVVQIVFEYIDLIKSGVRKEIFEETQSVASLSFDFMEKINPLGYTKRMVEAMQRCYPPRLILSGEFLISEYNPEIIMEHMKYLRPNNFRLFITCQNPPNNVKFTEKEKWYETEYTVENFDDSYLQMLENVKQREELHLPKPNEFMPKNMDVDKREVVEPAKRPNLIISTPGLRLWHKKDDTFWVPKAYVFILIRSPHSNGSLSNNVKTNLFLALLKDLLDEYAYYAEVAYLIYNVENTQSGIKLKLEGFNDKLPVLLEHLLSKIRHFKLSQSRFKMIKDKQCKVLKNISMLPPYQHARPNFDNVMEEKYWMHTEELKELEAVEIKDIEAFHSQLLSQLYFEALFHGNLSEEAAKKMMTSMQDILGSKGFDDSQNAISKVVALPNGSKWLYQVDVENPEEESSAIRYAAQIGNITQKRLRCEAELFAQIASEPYFAQIRTKEQLGYLVYLFLDRKNGVVDLVCLVQGDRDPAYLESRIEAFLLKQVEDLKTMKKEDFEKQVNALISKKKEKSHQLGDEADKFWSKISIRHYEFDQAKNDIEELNAITQESLIQFAEQYVKPNSVSIRKMSVHVRSQKLFIKEFHLRMKGEGMNYLSYKDLEEARAKSNTLLAVGTAPTPTNSAHDSQSGYDENMFLEELFTKLRTNIAIEKKKAQDDVKNMMDDKKRKIEQTEDVMCEEIPVDTLSADANGFLEKEVVETFLVAKQLLENALKKVKEPNEILKDNTLIKDPVKFKQSMTLERTFPLWKDE